MKNFFEFQNILYITDLENQDMGYPIFKQSIL
jgi:hypothetical protein